MAKEKHFVKKNSPVSGNVKFWALAVGLIGFLLYLNTVANDYVLDDNYSILQNTYVQQGISGIPKLMTIDYWYARGVSSGYYRPLALISFAIEHSFFGNNPHGSHLINALLYGLTGFILFLFLLQLFPKKHIVFSFIICLLFIANPIHTEVVANIKSRDELLSFLNIIGMCYFAFIYTKTLKIQNLIWSLVFCYLALLSKETALLGVAFLALCFYYKKQPNMAIIRRIVPYLGIIVFFFIQKQYFLQGVGSVVKDSISYPYSNASIKLPTTFHIFELYLEKLAIPWPLCFDYSFNQIPASHFSDVGAILGLIAFIALVIFTIRGLIARDMVGFSLAFIFITITPAVGFVLLRGGIMAERFLYAPSLGIAILLVFAGSKIPGYQDNPSLSIRQWIKKNRTLMIISLLVFSCYGFATFSRNSDWKDNITLFAADNQKADQSAQEHDLYGNALINAAKNEKDSSKRKEYFEKGLHELSRATTIEPRFGDAYFQMGYAYQSVYPNTDSAIKYYKKAAEATNYPWAYNNLGTLYQALGKYNLASYYYNQTLLYNPNFREAQLNKEAIKKSTGLDVQEFPGGDKTDAPIAQQKAKTVSPDQQKIFEENFNAGKALLPNGNYAGAISFFEKAEEQEPENTENLLYLANCEGLSKNYKKAINTFEKILLINPNDTVIMNNLAQTYLITGQKTKSNVLVEKVKKARK